MAKPRFCTYCGDELDRSTDRACIPCVVKHELHTHRTLGDPAGEKFTCHTHGPYEVGHAHAPEHAYPRARDGGFTQTWGCAMSQPPPLAEWQIDKVARLMWNYKGPPYIAPPEYIEQREAWFRAARGEASPF